MNEQRRAEQLQIADERMAQLNDTDWLQQHPAAELEGDGWIEAGNGLQPYVAGLERLAVPDVKQMKAQVKVLSILLPVLRERLESCELGASFEAVYVEAQSLLFERIQQAAVAHESWIEALMVAHERDASVGREQVREKLGEILTLENWQKLAKVAAYEAEKQILKQAQVEIPATV